MVMKKSVVVSAGGGDLQNLLTLAETATTVGACRVCSGFCSHRDVDACYSTVTKRKAFLETQLFLHHPSIGKSSTKRARRNPQRRRRPLPPLAASSDTSEPLEVAPFSTATESTGMRKKITLVIRIRRKPEEEFPRSLRDRVYQTVGKSSKFTLAIRKKLTKTDLSRLSIPVKKIAKGFLTDEEKAQLNNPADHQKIRIEAFWDPDMEKVPEDVYLSRWKTGKRYMDYVIGRGWTNLVKRQKLIEGDEVELWSFRNLTGSLCFAMVTVEARTAAAVAAAKEELSH